MEFVLNLISESFGMAGDFFKVNRFVGDHFVEHLDLLLRDIAVALTFQRNVLICFLFAMFLLPYSSSISFVRL